MRRFPPRRAALVGAGALALLAAAAPAADAAKLRQMGGALEAPVWVGAPRTGGLFAVEQPGRVMRFYRGRWLPFLNIRSLVGYGGEQGLLSVAFHPNFARNHRLFVYYNRKGDGALTIARFTANSTNTAASASTRHVLLTIAHPGESNHNGGMLNFGPDGYLWAGTGDGGGGGDQPNNAQNPHRLLGKMLRIDVNRTSAGRRYAIPATNPYADGRGGRPEIWALGVRNPWRWTFDRSTGDLWIADVGQDRWEEIDLVRRASLNDQTPVRNFGWRRWEGSHGYTDPGSRTGLTFPIAEYGHSGSLCSISGGAVYRRRTVPSIAGRYVFGDLCSSTLFTLVRRSGRWVRAPFLRVPGGAVVAVLPDARGELYVVSQGSNRIYRIEP